MRVYYVQYKVKGRDGDFTAGPYPRHEVLDQMDDIAGYENIYDVRIIGREE